MVSLPAWPISVSLPLPPSIESLPARPDTESVWAVVLFAGRATTVPSGRVNCPTAGVITSANWVPVTRAIGFLPRPRASLQRDDALHDAQLRVLPSLVVVAQP